MTFIRGTVVQVAGHAGSNPFAYEIDPLNDIRWTHLVEKHPLACAFHTHGWLRALKLTYGYEPFALTTAQPGEALRNGIVLCRIRSWLTGSRIVSLPFSDHCTPLVDDAVTLGRLLDRVKQYKDDSSLRYIEIRPLPDTVLPTDSMLGFVESSSYCFHSLDLRENLQHLFHQFHKSCVQRKLSRAKREELTIEEGHSERILRMFHALMLLTRRRHELPPQPFSWFRNLANFMGDKLLIRVALKNKLPIASILTISHNRNVIYKYGCSDAAYHSLGGMPLLFWDAIQHAKQTGAEQFDFGRSEIENEGLIAFKSHWGASVSRLTYYRYPPAATVVGEGLSRMTTARKVLSMLPNHLLSVAGTLLYRHMG